MMDPVLQEHGHETLDEYLEAMVGRPLRLGPNGIADDELERIKWRVESFLRLKYLDAPEVKLISSADCTEITLLHRAPDGAWRGLQEWVDAQERRKIRMTVRPEGMTLAEWNEAMQMWPRSSIDVARGDRR